MSPLRAWIASNGTHLASFEPGADPRVWTFDVASGRLGPPQRLSSILAHIRGHLAVELTADRFPARLVELAEERRSAEQLRSRW